MRAWYWLRERCIAVRTRYWGIHLDAAQRRKAKAKRQAKRRVR